MSSPLLPAASASLARDRCWALRPEELAPHIDAATFGFCSTEELEPLDQVVGQERAMRALEFGLGVRHRGYNVYVSGMTGAGKKQLVQRLLEQRAQREPTPPDWVYVHNFDEPDRPLAIQLASGQGVKLRDALEQIVERLRRDLPAALKAKDFDAERDRLAAAFGERAEALFQELAVRARQLDMAIRRLPNGVLVFVPVRDGRPLEPPEIEQLSEQERADIERRQLELSELAAELMARQHELTHEMRQAIQAIVRDFARRIIEPLIQRVKDELGGPQLSAWLDRVQGTCWITWSD